MTVVGKQSSPTVHQRSEEKENQASVESKPVTIKLRLKLTPQPPPPEPPTVASPQKVVKRLKLKCQTPPINDTPAKKHRLPKKGKRKKRPSVDENISSGIEDGVTLGATAMMVQPDPPKKRGRPKGSVNKRKELKEVKHEAHSTHLPSAARPPQMESEADKLMWRLIREYVEGRVTTMTSAASLAPFASKTDAIRRMWPFYETLSTIEASPSPHYRNAMQAALDCSSDARQARFEQTLSAIRNRVQELQAQTEPLPRDLGCVLSRFLLQEDRIIWERNKAEFIDKHGTELFESIMRPVATLDEAEEKAVKVPDTRPPPPPPFAPPASITTNTTTTRPYTVPPPAVFSHRPKLLPKVIRPPP